MDIKKQKMLCAVKLWAILQGMEEIIDDESYRYWTDIAFKKGDEIIGFITEFDRSKTELIYKIASAKRENVDFIYVVTNDNGKRRKLLAVIPDYCGILCYSNPYGLGFLYQILKKPSLIP